MRTLWRFSIRPSHASKEYFGGHEGFVEEIEIRNSDSPDWEELGYTEKDPGEYSFDLPIVNASCHHKQGYWDIWPLAHYSSYFYPYAKDINGAIRLWPREDAFDIARIFAIDKV